MHYIELHLGPMFSGKTSHLNQLASRTIAVGHTVELWLPPMTEAGKRNAEKSKAVSLLPRGAMIRYMNAGEINPTFLANLHSESAEPVDVVLIDETHFFDANELVTFFMEQLPPSHPYAHSEFHCFGLNGTYQLSPWPTISQLIPLATKIRHYQANCSRCGHKVKAGFSHLKTIPQSSQDIKIEGGSDLYEALCYQCMQQSLLDK